MLYLCYISQQVWIKNIWNAPKKFWNNFLILSSFLVLWENVFHIVTYLFNLKRSAEVAYSENTAESENPKCHKSKELPLFKIFLCELLTLVEFSYRSKLTLIPTMVLKMLQFRDLTRTFNTYQVVFLRFILDCGSFCRVSVRDIFVNVLRFLNTKKRDSFMN